MHHKFFLIPVLIALVALPLMLIRHSGARQSITAPVLPPSPARGSQPL